MAFVVKVKLFIQIFTPIVKIKTSLPHFTYEFQLRSFDSAYKRATYKNFNFMNDDWPQIYEHTPICQKLIRKQNQNKKSNFEQMQMDVQMENQENPFLVI